MINGLIKYQSHNLGLVPVVPVKWRLMSLDFMTVVCNARRAESDQAT